MMHDDTRRLDLSLPLIPVGKNETPYSLRKLLYKGGASVPMNHAEQAIQSGLLGNVDASRGELVRLTHEHINGNLAAGGSPRTARSKIWELNQFFAWADRTGASLGLTEVLHSYLNWSEHLLERVRVVKDINQRTIYTRASLVGQVLDDVLGRTKPILRTTRIKMPRTRNPPQSGKAEKQSLNDTFALGRLLQDICDGTSLGVIRGTPHVQIPLSQGGEIGYTFSYKGTKEKRKIHNVIESHKRMLAYETDRSIDHRFRKSLINLRIQAELLMFIGQTGMNLAQA